MGFARTKAPLALSEARDGSMAEVNRPARETALRRIRDWAAILAALLLFFVLMTFSFDLLVGLVFLGGAVVAAGVAVGAHVTSVR